MEWAINSLLKWRYRPFILFFIFFGVLLSSLYIPLPDEISLSFLTRSILGVIASTIITVISWHLQKPPMVKKGHVGIIIAIKSEDQKTKGRISKDFVETSKRLLGESQAHQPFQLIELNEFFSELIKDHSSANKFRRLCGGHLLIFGDTVQRMEGGKNLYVLRLQGIVCHNPISTNDQTLLAQEMNSLLPLKNFILEENELSGFEITSIQFAEATKYVIATAALLSQDYNLSIALLEEIQQCKSKLKKNTQIKAISKLIKLVPKRLAEAYLFASRACFATWEESRSNNDLQKSIDWIVKYDKMKSGQKLDVLLLMAIGHFVFSRDIDAAMQCINQCKSRFITDPSWKYSAAFLQAYKNNLDIAKDLYDAAIPTERGFHLPFQIEGFIAWALDNEPKRTQLNFCLGYLNELFKNDSVSARQYYLKFLNSTQQNGFSKRSFEHAKNFL